MAGLRQGIGVRRVCCLAEDDTFRMKVELIGRASDDSDDSDTKVLLTEYAGASEKDSTKSKVLLSSEAR